MAENVFDRNFHFFNILPYSCGDEELLAQDAIEFTRRTGIRNVLYCLTMNPMGVPAMNKVHHSLESYRRLKSGLAGSPVRLGVLFQAVLGHGVWSFPPEDLKARPVEPWVRMVNVDGERTRYCPLDPRFRQYIFDMTVLFAGEAPCFILGDDDIRSFCPKAECFCELHTAEFNRLTGKNFTPEEYRQAVIRCRPGDEICQAYETLRRGIPNGVAAIIRQAVDSVDPEIRCGSCMPGWEYLFNGETARCFAGKHPPVMRIANADYGETSAKHYPGLAVLTQALRQAHEDIPVVLDEADTCPHNLWSRAAVSFHAKLCSSILAGVNGAKLWYVNAHKNGVPISRNYTDILAENRGLYQTLTGEVQKTVLSGVNIPAHKNFSLWHAAHYAELRKKLLLIPENNMASDLLGQLGIPFKASFDYSGDDVYALSGEDAVTALSVEELEKLLAGKLLLDGPAAAAVCARGYSRALGIEAEKKVFSYNREVRVDGRGSYVISMDERTPFFTVKDPAAEVLTELRFISFAGADDEKTVAPGTVIYRNAFGGTVCSMAFHHEIVYSTYNIPRKMFLIELLERLRGEALPVFCTAEQNVTVLTRTYPDGAVLAAVCNINFDPLHFVELHCAKVPRRVEYLDGEGAWQPMDFSVNGQAIRLERPLGCYELVILRLQ